MVWKMFEPACPFHDANAAAIRASPFAFEFTVLKLTGPGKVVHRPPRAGELLRKGVEAGRVIRNFDLRDISAATAVALMEDMLAAKP